MTLNTKLINILKSSIYPFYFNNDCGKDLYESYKLISNSFLLIKNNKTVFQSTLGWDNKEYLKYLNINLCLIDLIYMLTHVYLKYPDETKLYHNILAEIESFYLTLFNDENLMYKDKTVNTYYQQIKKIHQIYYKLKHVYNAEMDKLLAWDDKFTKKYDEDKKEIVSKHLNI